jgi:mannose-6-phosphate isomerase
LGGIAQIAPKFYERIWGSTVLHPWFPDPDKKTGEVWFDSGDSLPLIKFLFTTEKLSIQVHPNDDFARLHENGASGKTEMWHILRAAQATSVAIGFRQRVTVEQVRDAAVTGTIEGLLNWVSVKPGDTIFIPAGTVHAIGAGLTLCEIQQRSDVTYRIYDYGRPRELHLDKGLAVASLGPYPGRVTLPVRSPFFHTERHTLNGTHTFEPMDRASALIVLQGEGIAGDEPFLAGQVFAVEPNTTVTVRGQANLLRTYVPAPR